MQTARPPDGFYIDEKPAVAALIASKSKSFSRLPQFWSSIKERLSMTGHREGVELPRGKPGWRLFVEDGAPQVGLPRVKVVYRALGDTLTIDMVDVQ
jgi:hypothetical protein